MRNFTSYICLILLTIMLSCRKDEHVLNNNVTPHDFLSNSKYDKLVVEIQYVAGYQPTAAAVDNLKEFLQQRLNKSEGIIVLLHEILSSGNSYYTLEDIKNIEKANRTQSTSRKTLTAYLFFADKEYAGNSGNSKVLGIAYGSSSMAIFEKTIKDFTGGITQPPLTSLETTVVHHEFGHILGLVNNGTGMQSEHQDSTHGKHCDNKDCLMYYTAETSEIVANMLGGNIPILDANCVKDLQLNGGK